MYSFQNIRNILLLCMNVCTFKLFSYDLGSLYLEFNNIVIDCLKCINNQITILFYCSSCTCSIEYLHSEEPGGHIRCRPGSLVLWVTGTLMWASSSYLSRQHWLPGGWLSAREGRPQHSDHWSQWSCVQPSLRHALLSLLAVNCRSLHSVHWSRAGTLCPVSWSWPPPQGDRTLQSAWQQSCSCSSWCTADM